MERLQVTPENLRRIATEVDGLADEYRSKYESIYAMVDNMTSQDWRGKDADAFKSKVEEFRDDFGKMKQLMNDYATHLRKAADDYERREQEAADRARSMQG